MRKIFYIINCLMIVFTFTFAEDGTDNTILIFDGGETNAEFSFYWQALSQSGQSISYKSKDVWDVWNNPASFVSFDKTYVNFSFMPGFSIDADEIIGFDTEIQPTVDDALIDYRTNSSLVKYPRLEAEVGQKSGLYGFQIAVPFNFYKKTTSVLSFKIGQPIFVDLDVINNGLITMIETSKSVGDQSMLIHMKMDMLLQTKLSVKSTDYTIGFAHKLNDKFAIGLQMANTQIHTYISDKIITNGIMELAGNEYAFNDPNDPHINFDDGETNTLDQSLLVDFIGNSWKIHAGGLYKVSKSFVIGLDYSHQTSAIIKGDMSVSQYKIPALNFEAMGSDDDDAELVDATLLNLSSLTATEKVENKVSDKMEIYFPSSVGFQMSYQKPIFESTLSLYKYFNSFGYNFLDEKQYHQMNFGINYQLTIGVFKLALGGINGDVIKEKNGEEEATQGIWIPHGSMEIAFNIKNFHISNKLFVSPTPGVGIGIGYFF